MSGIGGDWAVLSSEHERLVLSAEDKPRTAYPVCEPSAPWAELASQRERLIELAAPLSGLASSSDTAAGPRLVVRAA